MHEDDDNLFQDGETSKFQSELPDNNSEKESGAEDDGQERKYKRLLKQFRVLDADEVERLLLEDEEREERKRGGGDKQPSVAGTQQLKINNMLPTTPNTGQKTMQGASVLSKQPPAN